ncbi:hypothetical protein ZHAS_00007565 [Anopheles sinensis]|uniref:Uncharacterized protein n=1 Tax=Anopheles sinensis TaxID=74873 RepID=A0A084VQE8_ANOSI|nr:hypothetical protein ZHAS_00007565 [Anopheles sinensis]
MLYRIAGVLNDHCAERVCGRAGGELLRRRRMSVFGRAPELENPNTGADAHWNDYEQCVACLFRFPITILRPIDPVRCVFASPSPTPCATDGTFICRQVSESVTAFISPSTSVRFLYART